MHRALFAAVLLSSLAACSDDDPALPSGVATESVCPPANAPTYDTFGQAFMATYCTTCHDSAKTGTQRGGAPLGADFETRTKLRLWTRNIDRKAAFGPAAENTAMPPPGHPAPTDAERTRLGEYIACEVAQ